MGPPYDFFDRSAGFHFFSHSIDRDPECDQQRQLHCDRDDRRKFRGKVLLYSLFDSQKIMEEPCCSRRTSGEGKLKRDRLSVNNRSKRYPLEPVHQGAPNA